MEDEPLIKVRDVDEDDPVVQEIPIINSKKLENMLHIFQYPLNRPGDVREHKISKCFYKPKNEMVKIELAINTESSNFDSIRAEFVANEVDGNKSKSKKECHFQNGIVDKVQLMSTKIDAQNYSIAAFNGREIHLTPLKGIFQFRPKFPYLEKSLKRKKDVLNNSNSDDEQAGPSSAQHVTVKFKKSVDAKSKNEYDASYREIKQRINDEPWNECEWHGKDSTLSNIERLKLISDNTDDLGYSSNLNNGEYMKLLVPEDKEETPLIPALPSHVLSIHALRELPVQEQCRLLLKDGQIYQFQQLMMLLPGVSSDILLRSLQKVAVLVRGNWVVKSEILYPSDTHSATSGVPSELMCRARDYVLYLFTKHQYVERKKVASIMKIPSEEIQEIFTGISHLRTHNKGWELALPTDVDFASRHSDLVTKQNRFWEQRFQQLSEYLKDNQKQRRKSKSVSESEGKPRTNSISMSSDNESGTENTKSPLLSRKAMNNVNISNTRDNIPG